MTAIFRIDWTSIKESSTCRPSNSSSDISADVVLPHLLLVHGALGASRSDVLSLVLCLHVRFVVSKDTPLRSECLSALSSHSSRIAAALRCFPITSICPAGGYRRRQNLHRWVKTRRLEGGSRLKNHTERVMPPTPSGQDHCCYRSVGASGSLRQNLIVISALKLDILERLACKHHCFLSKSVSQPGSMLEIEFLLLGWRLAQDACSRPDLRNRNEIKREGRKTENENLGILGSIVQSSMSPRLGCCPRACASVLSVPSPS